MANYFNSYNPWAQLAVMGRSIGDSLAGEMYKQPQLKYELARQQQQDAQNEWYKNQQLKLQQEDNDRQLATSTLHNQGLQLNNDVLTRNAAIANQVRQLGQQQTGQAVQQEMMPRVYPAIPATLAPSESLYDSFGPRTTPTNELYRDLNEQPNVPQELFIGQRQMTIGGPTIAALNTHQNASVQALANEQAALRGQLAPALLGQERQANLMELGAMRNANIQSGQQQKASEFEQKQQLAERRLQMDQEYKEAMADISGQKLQQYLENSKRAYEVNLRNADYYAANFEMAHAQRLSEAIAAKNQPLVDSLNAVKSGLNKNTAGRFKIIELK